MAFVDTKFVESHRGICDLLDRQLPADRVVTLGMTAEHLDTALLLSQGAGRV